MCDPVRKAVGKQRFTTGWNHRLNSIPRLPEVPCGMALIISPVVCGMDVLGNAVEDTYRIYEANAWAWSVMLWRG
ncbi:hypothetical protein ACFLUL_00010 [Chloroflexota bacterium]